jgi:hypothetical protein
MKLQQQVGAHPRRGRRRQLPLHALPCLRVAGAVAGRLTTGFDAHRAARRSPANSCCTLEAIAFTRVALSSGTMPPDFSARAIRDAGADANRSAVTRLRR